MCGRFIASIADVEKTMREVIEFFFSLLSDVSTDARIIEQEIVFVQFVNKQGQPWTKFVDTVPLESATADGVCSTTFRPDGKPTVAYEYKQRRRWGFWKSKHIYCICTPGFHKARSTRYIWILTVNEYVMDWKW